MRTSRAMRLFRGLLGIGFLTVLSATPTFAAGPPNPIPGPPIDDAIWGDGHLYNTVLTPTQLPDKGPTDGIFNFQGQAGQRSVAEAKPGDADYNGGRWHVYLVEYTEAGLAEFDQNGDGNVDEELMYWEDVEDAINMGFVEVTGEGPRFVCPLSPN